MRKPVSRRPSPALVIACIALAISLSGTGYATVMQVSKNSVGTQQLKRNAVTARKLSPNAVRSGHVLNGSLLVEDFKAGQIPAGPKGEKGDKGDRGAPGPVEGVSAVDGGESTQPSTLIDQWGFAPELASAFTTSRTGTLLLVKNIAGFLNCTSGTVWFWLTLDGVVVRESLILGTAGTTTLPMTLTGITPQPVPAGRHTVSAGGMCFSGTPLFPTGAIGYSGGTVVVLG